MSVHYKFKSALEYDTVTFDGLHISVKDLKNAILQQKRIGKSTDFDLQVTNAQTKEVYEDENMLIPKNTSLLIARIPILTPKTKPWEGYGGDNTPPPKIDEGPIAKTADLSSLDASEDDKIKAMMSQSTQDYDPSNYMKIRGANQMGVVPPNYRCHKCHQGGHWIKDCTFGQGSDPIEIKKSTGIPRNFLVPVDGPQVPGAMMTPNGQYAVPLLDLQAYNQKVTSAPVIEQKTEIPEDLLCSICSDLLADAVMIPCCGNSFCDECIRSVLLESEDHECPDCHEKDISPDTLIPNRFLRTSVANFRNTTGYVKKSIYRERHERQKPKHNETAPAKDSTPPQESEREPNEKLNPDEKTIISEADSTEHSKNAAKDDGKKPAETETSIEGPPGVSPKTSPKGLQEHRDKRSKEREKTKERSSKEREFRERKGVRRNSRNRYRGDSPRKNTRRVRSSKSPYNSPVSRGEERSATPTVDEPTTGNGIFNPPVTYGNSNSMPPLMPHMNPMSGAPPPFPSNHPPPISSYPPSQGPPPNYRMPPPGTAPYLPPGSYPPVPPRALYDTSRPPIGLPPSFNPSFPPRAHREFSRRLRERTPPGVIDDPLAAFNRMLREKDERKRRAKRRSSYSRSRSRSPRSFSRSPVRRRSRSPRMSRRSRSRSRSFSLSRSRSRSFSGSPRGTPYRSPARRSSPPPRRGPSRYKSPLPPARSPPPRSRHERHRSRDYDEDRDYLYKERSRNRDRRSRDRDRYYDSYDDRRGGSRQQQQWAAGQQRPLMQDNFYPPEIQPGYPPNRFAAGPPRDFGLPPPPPFSQPLPQTIHNIQRQFQDIHPPGVDDDIAPPGVDEPPQPAIVKSPKREEKAAKRSDKEKKRHDRTPEKKVPSSPKRRSKSNTPDRHNKKKRRESSDREERKRDDSDDDKGKRSKDKKKHKEKKETERKKKKDKKEKHKKDSKDKKSKEEFKQVVPKSTDDSVGDEPRKSDEPKSPIEEKHVKTEEVPAVATKEKPKTDEERPRKPREEKSLKPKDEEKPKKPKESEKRKIEEIPNEDRRTESSPVKKPKERKVEPEEPVQRSPERKPELYADILEEGVDTGVMEEYGKIEKEINKTTTPEPVDKGLEEEEEEEKDVLELHSNDIDLKGLDKSDILAPMPEKSKWEVEEDVPLSPKDTYKSDSKSDKSGKVTNEVLKRAENAIFAKAINAIRPIEIKKISTDRAKLYSGEREVEKTHNKLQITVSSTLTEPPSDASQHAARLPVKERLGIKIDDPDKVISLVKKRARTISPFSRRGEGGRNHEPGDRRTETESRSRHDKGRRSRSKQRDSSKDRHRSRAEDRRRSRNKRSEERRDRNRNKSKEKSSSKRDEDDVNDERSRRKRTRSRAESEEPKHKKKDRKPKKEKTKKKEEADKEPTKTEEEPVKPSAVTKRKPTIDEASFEPDYDLESHSDEEIVKKKAKKHSEEEKSSSSESASSSSSEEDRKKKKRKKHRKKRKKESSSSNTSESESDSSDSDKGKKRKKHRKSKKKKKRSKHK